MNRILILMIRTIYTFRTDYFRVLFIFKMTQLIFVLPAIFILYNQFINTDMIYLSRMFILIVLLFILTFNNYEIGFYMLLAYYQQKHIPYTLRQIWQRLNKKVLYFIALQSVFIFLYIVLLMPLITLLIPSITQTINFPTFIIDDIFKTSIGRFTYLAIIIALCSLSLRLLFSMQFFIINDRMTVVGALKASFKISKRNLLKLAMIMLFILILSTALLAFILVIIFIPLFFIDEFLPMFSHVMASFTLAAAQCIMFFMFGVLQAMFSQLFVFISFKFRKFKPVAHSNKSFYSGIMRRGHRVAIFALILWGGIHYFTIANFLYEPDTKIIGHRGFLDKGVENTISSLHEAVNVGSDLVEIDVQQTKDGEFVVFHDKTLRRLAGRTENVYNMTLEELMNITVSSDGNRDKISSLDQMLNESKKLKVKLLIELKIHGYETDDFIEKLVSKLKQYDSLESHYIQSNEVPLAVAMHAYEPRLKVGTVHGVAIGSLPDYGLDFVAIEQSFVTRSILAQAKKQSLEVFVWTVNTRESIQKLLMANVDGIITNYPDITYALRAEFEENKHFIQRVLNKLN